MTDFQYADNGDKIGIFSVGSNVSGTNSDSNTLANVSAGAAGYVDIARFVANAGLTLVNIISDASAANRNKVVGVCQLETPVAGQQCTIQQTRIAQVIAGGVVAADADVYTDAQGRAVDAAVANIDGSVQGRALTAAAAAGEYISVLLSK